MLSYSIRVVPNIFISYSHRDEAWRNELVRHLRVLERGGILHIWDTSEIQAGTNWSTEIREKLNHADLAVILVSPDALASDFIVESELPALIHRQRAGEIVVVPVLLRSSPWIAIEGFAELQFANSPSRPLAELSPSERDAIFAQIAERIGSLARAVSQRKSENDAKEAFREPAPKGDNGATVYFISHAREDGDFAELVKVNLERKGCDGWIDTDRLLPGIDWRQEIDETIRRARAVIAVMSPEARASEYVTYEWAFAWGCGKKIVPLMLRETSLHPFNTWIFRTGSVDLGTDSTKHYEVARCIISSSRGRPYEAASRVCFPRAFTANNRYCRIRTSSRAVFRP